MNYAGYSDWKLPDKKELASLMNYEVINPCSDFPNMPSVSFWSSTSHMLEPEKAWVAGFSGGDVYMRSKADLYHVRCVTGNR